ncbi:immunodeficiency virus type I enhancer binding protein, putative [Pediculus humanus corporis]|uniref:Immunodeficiency virus type I enhancer binding protein, putative n=1 Tax=Pediculus humanus subsp. corporis TaxID=121224 RepID=E0VXZ9_PEDHC|nr:immunodeficiency virus type I enhancer binding protein, putative [Pediculus humanus corporis]EEB18255.1 immunodeficiency virus type I enhancer binding protein, putative [Pediculus humanus corporis]
MKDNSNVADCTNQSSIKTTNNRVSEFTPVSLKEKKNVEISNENYLHKKFKKIAAICDYTAKTEKTEVKNQNGFISDLRQVESYKIDLVPAINERISNSRCNLNVSSCKNEGNESESGKTVKNSEVKQLPPPLRSCSSPKHENTRSPPTKKDDGGGSALSSSSGRYTCPYCQLACAKPSVLQKHIRAHTNERPYPCSPCGFAFKTKSNLYKHCRSQAHRFKTGEGQIGSEKCDSAEDEFSDDSGPNRAELSFKKVEVETKVVPTEVATPISIAKPTTKASESETNDNQYKIYKPKFHKANLYQDDNRYGSVNKDNVVEEKVEKQKTGEENERVVDKAKEVTCVVETPYLSPGPLLGTTPLVDVKTEVGPPPKKRRTQSMSPNNAQNYENRRLSTSSLPCPISPSNGLTKTGSRTTSSSPSATLKSLEELSKYPMKPSLNMFGGEVKILDCGETKTMRIEPNPNPQSPVDASTKNTSKFFVTIAKTGLHSGGGTLVQVPASTAQSNIFQIANILNYPDTKKLLMPLMPNISTPNLAVPGVPTPNLHVPPKTFSEIATIPAQIPYVPGIPGPQTILPAKVTENIVKKDEVKKSKETKSTVSSLISIRKSSSSNQIKNVPNDIPKIEISAPTNEVTECKKDDLVGKKETGLKFLRPTSLPLRPGSFTPKRLHQGITPTVLSLVSPETPRPKKSYGQLFLNGHAYTYLGLKCSTRSYYCTISRPQPMYVEQTAQYPKLSMYSNWKVYSESEPSLLGLTPAKAMAHYDSRHRSSSYTIASKNISSNSGGILTHSSSWLKNLDKQQQQQQQQPHKDNSKTEQGTENSSWTAEAPHKRVKIFAGGYESNEDYTYVRGRGRGKYFCEECGIRCKKPSMLKKHIRTHTDVRPYTCKHCTFSFKTKGNLTKHMKSKAHYKKCMVLNVHPIPTTVEMENIDEELLVKQQAMKQDENEESENEEDDDEDDSDEGEEENIQQEDSESLEREAASGLLSLSEMTTGNSQYKLLYVTAGLIPKSTNGIRPNTYPPSLLLSKSSPLSTSSSSSPSSSSSSSTDTKLKPEFFPPSSGPSPSYVSVTEDGRSICVMCNKIFTKASQLKLHVNIHYFERPYRCEPCAVSFRTKGHLQKHERSGSHHNKVSMNTTFGTATTSNPRPFNCDDCKIAFRIHGHLAKHLRSKMHIMKLECIGKLPFGTYAEMERSGVNLNEIDTTDCENSLESLQVLAQKLYNKDSALVPLASSSSSSSASSKQI